MKFSEVYENDEAFVIWVLGLSVGSEPGLGSFQRYCAEGTGLRSSGPQSKKKDPGFCAWGCVALGSLILAIAAATVLLTPSSTLHVVLGGLTDRR